MKKIRLFASALLVAMSVSAFAAENLVCEGLVTRSGNNNCDFGNKFEWTASNANTMQLFAFDAGTLSDYTSMKITFRNFYDRGTIGGSNKTRILFRSESADLKTQSYATLNNSGTLGQSEKTIDLTSFLTEEQRSQVTQIVLGGCTGPGFVMIDPTDIKLVKSDASELVCSEITPRSGNNNVKYTENVFMWTASSANTIQMFAFEAGTLSNYKTLELTTSDFDGLGIEVGGSDLKYRVIFFAGNTNVKTLTFASTGSKSIDLAEKLTADEIASITEIAFGGINSGVCTRGLLTINPSDIYLTPIQSTPTAIDDVTAATKSVKLIENGQVVILRDGVRYNALGQVVK